MRKTIFLAIFIIVLIITGIGFYLTNQSESYTENSAFKAVPLHSPLVIEVPSIKDLKAELLKKSPLTDELKSVEAISSLFFEISSIEKLIAENASAKRIFQNKSAVIAFNFSGKNEIGSLIAISLSARSEKSQLISLLQNFPGGSLSKRVYDGVEVYEWKGNQQAYHFTIKNGIFLLSRFALFVEEGIRQISVDNLLDQKQFKALYSTVGSNSDLNVFINHKKFPRLIRRIVPQDFKKLVNAFGDFADWTELDVNINETSLLMGGFSFSNSSNVNYLNTFRRQEAGRSNMEDMISANASFFINLNLSKLDSFFEDYEEFLKKQGNFYTRETDLKKIERYSRTNFIELFTEIADKNFAVVYGNVNRNAPTGNRFFIAEVKSQSQAREKLLKLLENYAKANKKGLNDLKSNYQIQNENKFEIYQFPFSGLPALLFGKAFSGVASNFLCFYNNYLLFADDLASLRGYIHDLVLNETLRKDIYYQKFSQQLASRSSFSLYLNFSKSFYLKDHYLNEKLSEILSNNEESVRKFYALGWQFSASSGQFLNNLYLQYDPVLKEEPQTIWRSKLDGNVAIKPQLVDNHRDPNNKEVVIQDDQDNLYLINKEGVAIWKLKLPGKIMGEIHQIDYYRNGRLQYLFNTKNQLHLIDRNGNNVARFPINFRSPATNGVAVFDYDNNRNYRFFIACENKKIYAYDREGRIVSGWKFKGTDRTVLNPVKHFRVNNKDYIICSDRYKTYILDRQGRVRVTTSVNFEHSQNHVYLVKDEGGKPALAATDTKGLIHLQFFDGTNKTLDVGSFGSKHHFTTGDLTGDGKTDYIFADGNELKVYSVSGKKMIEYRFNETITNRPNIYTFSSSDRKIGVVCSNENRIYLLNPDGTIYDGFPLHGNTDFSIGYFNRSNPYFNLVVGNKDNSFFNYRVE